MKLIFLDFDGVLNSLPFLASEPGRMDRLDPAAVVRLNAIVARSGAKVVISSTWRLKRSLDELRARLSEVGFIGEIIDRTPELRERGLLYIPLATRSQEILMFIEGLASPPESFVALDDADLDDIAQNHVKTDFAMGLLDEHVEAALWILGEAAALSTKTPASSPRSSPRSSRRSGPGSAR